MKIDLRKALLYRNYDQEAMAEALGISQSAYGKIESGTTILSLDRCFILAEALDMTIYEFIRHITGIPNIPTVPGFTAILIPEGGSINIKL